MPTSLEPESGSSSSSPSFSGFYSPRTTPVPDNFFDEVLPDLSGAEVKVLLYIFRRTFGFKKDSDNIALSQMVGGITKKDGTVLDRGTGLSKAAVAEALKQLVAKGMVKKTRRSSAERGHQPTTYEPVLAGEPPLVQKSDKGVVRNLDKPLSENWTHNKQLDKRTVLEGSPLKRLPNLELPAEQVELIAQDIVAALGDSGSLAYYQLVARTVPEDVIREQLAQIKQDGARDPRRLFTYRMHKYALERLL